MHALPVALLLLGLNPADVPVNPVSPQLVASELVAAVEFPRRAVGLDRSARLLPHRRKWAAEDRLHRRATRICTET